MKIIGKKIVEIEVGKDELASAIMQHVI